MYKRAVILAGGKGTRLRPYTKIFPKPMMPIGKFPILEIVVKQLKFYGFNHITIAVGHQAHVIKTYFGNGSKFKVLIDYIQERKPLSTMGPLKLIKNLPDNFLVMNGDVLTDLNFDKFFRYHKIRKYLFTISSYSRSELLDYGLLETNKNEFLKNFFEKPTRKFNVSMGVYMLNKKILNYIPNNKSFGFDNLMLKLLKSKIKVKTKKHTGYWLDIGRPNDYILAVDQFHKIKNKLIHD